MIRTEIVKGDRHEVEQAVASICNNPIKAAGMGPSGVGSRPGAGLRSVSFATSHEGGLFYALVVYEDSA